MDASDLHVVLVCNLLELVPLLGQLGQSDVYGGSQGSSQVGGAAGNVTEVSVVGELGKLLNVSGCAGKSVEHLVEVSTLLQGNDSELILFVDPDEESLVVIVEDTSAFGPFSVKTASLQESVSLPIEQSELSKCSNDEIIMR